MTDPTTPPPAEATTDAGTQAATEPRTVAASGGTAGAPVGAASAHRVLAALAGVSVLLALNAPWRSVTASSRAAGTAFAFAFPLVLTAVVIGLTARTARLMRAADATVLAVAVVAAAVPFRHALHGHVRYLFDESALSHLAARAVAHGHDPYTARWPSATVHAPTLLFDGRLVDRYGYPPLSPLLAGAVARVAPGTSETALLGLAALVASAVLAFVLLPDWARPLAVLAVVTVSLLPFLTQSGYPYATATPFLLFAVVGWTRVGAGGRLARRGVAQALCLGLAVSAQQYVWFVAPFLLVLLWRVRRGEFDRAGAARVAGRITALVAAAFAAVDLPFVVAAPRAWLDGVLSPLTQHALFNGPGLLNVSVRVVGGSGDLGLYGDAALVLYVGLLAAVALWPRQLGPGAVVLPVLVFWVSLRAQAIYYSQIGTVALVAAATLTPEAVAGARPLRMPARARVLVPAAAGALTAGLVVAAVIAPAPLDVRVTRSGTGLAVQLHNTSSRTVHPHFATAQGSTSSRFWRVRSGPAAVRPGGTGTYLLAPPLGVVAGQRGGRLYVVTDGPQGLSVGTIRR